MASSNSTSAGLCVWGHKETSSGLVTVTNFVVVALMLDVATQEQTNKNSDKGMGSIVLCFGI